MGRKVVVLGECDHCGTGLVFEKMPDSKSFIARDSVKIKRCIRCGAPAVYIKGSGVVKCSAGCFPFFVKDPVISQDGEGKVLIGRLELYQNPKSLKKFYCPSCGEPLLQRFRVKRVRVCVKRERA